MTKKQLAESLNISRTALWKLEKRGMPTDSLEAAIEWRRKNLDVMQTKGGWRIDGNPGIKRELTQVNNFDNLNDLSDIDSILNNLENKIAIKRTLTHTVPELWFEQPGWLGAILKDHGVKITAEQLLQVQACLYLVYMENVVEYLNESDDFPFYIGPVLKAQPGDEIYPSLMTRLNEILNAETTHQNQS